MREDTRRGIQECVLFGLVLGPLLATAEVVSYLALGLGAERPLRLAASLFVGEQAFFHKDGATVTMVAFGAHLLLAAIWGALFGAVAAHAPFGVRRKYLDQALLGMAFGALVWVVDFQLLGRLLSPWMLTDPILPQLLPHMLGFGLPLGLLFARAERRVPDLRDLDDSAHAH